MKSDDWTSETPASEPVTLAEAKAHLRVDIADDDSLITELIAAAREYAESYSRRAFIQRSVTARFSALSGELILPVGPYQSVTSFTYADGDGVSQTLSSSSDYQIYERNGYPRLSPYPGTTWPVTQSENRQPVTVVYVTGEAVSATGVAKNIKAAIKLILGSLYENREDVVVGQGLGAFALPHGSTRLLDQVKLMEAY